MVGASKIHGKRGPGPSQRIADANLTDLALEFSFPSFGWFHVPRAAQCRRCSVPIAACEIVVVSFFAVRDFELRRFPFLDVHIPASHSQSSSMVSIGIFL